jgi:hypothetical protein
MRYPLKRGVGYQEGKRIVSIILLREEQDSCFHGDIWHCVCPSRTKDLHFSLLHRRNQCKREMVSSNSEARGQGPNHGEAASGAADVDSGPLSNRV